ncbi:bacterial bifunctional deaminase-reductase [Wallemia mellicola]|nr:bacterial bifunctional deaminase-reductase [Wallemia mellicola]TIB95352.1 bacterial bifunctional deaminase-reductase [Wallemia mellicola]
MAMTHSLRLLSDAIIVGSGTLLNDNPGLNARIPSLAALEDQPTPVIIDPHFKCPVNAKIIENYKRGIGKAPILLTFEGSKSTQKLLDLEKSGVRIFGVLTCSDEGLRWDRSIFDKITKEFGFKRYMIEGGATVIRSLLSSKNVVDKLIVTVSPTLIGSDGVSIITDGDRPVVRHRANDQSVEAPPAFEQAEQVEQTEQAESSATGSNSGGAYNPETGEINWDCPCLGGMAYGPCGEEFKTAFSCFVYSEAEPKGIDCVEAFKGMQDCFRSHPEHYSDEIDEDDNEEKPEESTKKEESESTSDSERI